MPAARTRFFNPACQSGTTVVGAVALLVCGAGTFLPSIRSIADHRPDAPKAVVDFSRDKEQLAREAEAETGQILAAQCKFATGRPIRLSEIGRSTARNSACSWICWAKPSQRAIGQTKLAKWNSDYTFSIGVGADTARFRENSDRAFKR